MLAAENDARRAAAAWGLINWALVHPEAAVRANGTLSEIGAYDMPEGAPRLWWSAIQACLRSETPPDMAILRPMVNASREDVIELGKALDGHANLEDPAPLVRQLRRTSAERAVHGLALQLATEIETGAHGAPEIIRSLQDFGTELAGGPRRAFPAPLDLGRLAETPAPIPWLVHNYLARGEAAILGGIWGGGKSIVTLDLVLAVATGQPWLGCVPVERGPVVVVDEEQAQALVELRLRRAALGRGLDPVAVPELPITYWVQPTVNLRQPLVREAFTARLDDIRPALIVFDSLTRIAHGVDQNDATEVAAFFAEVITPLAIRYDAAVLVLHHVKKGTDAPSDAESLKNRLRGSGDIPGAVGSVLVLDTSGERRTLHHVKCRWQSEQPPVTVEFEGASGDPALRVVGASAASVDLETLITEALHGAALDGLLRSQVIALAEEAGVAPSAVGKAVDRCLGRLHAHRRVRKKGRGRGGVRFWMASLAPSDSE